MKGSPVRPGVRLALTMARYDLLVSSAAPLVDEIANELDTWPGVRIERRSDGARSCATSISSSASLIAKRPSWSCASRIRSTSELVEHGDADPAESRLDSDIVSHGVEGPSDVTAVLELFDRRYRELRGEDEPYSSQDPA